MALAWLEILTAYVVLLLVARLIVLLPRKLGHLWSPSLPALSLLRRSHRPAPARRPLEVVAYDVRRLGERYHHPQPGTAFAKQEAIRRAYDEVLAEACDAVGVVHLLGVLTPGPELDLERSRVEDSPWLAGMRISETA